MFLYRVIIILALYPVPNFTRLRFTSSYIVNDLPDYEIFVSPTSI
jgi:hypothetical protein